MTSPPRPDPAAKQWDEDETEPRFTLVHDRYHISGGFDAEKSDDGELIDSAMTRDEAFLVGAREYDPKRRYAWLEVFDAMARRGQPRRWSYDPKAQVAWPHMWRVVEVKS